MAGRRPKARRGRRRRAPVWFRLARMLAVLAILLVIVRITGCAERLFFWPTREAFVNPAGAEDVWFESDGLRLHGWFLRARDAEPGEVRPVIVHCHGNAANVSRHDVFVDFLPLEGFHVLIFDYRSYGRSEKGPLSREGLIRDAVAAIDYARDRADTGPVGVYGLSLGGTIGLAAATRTEGVEAVCTVGTFSGWRTVAGDYGGWLGRFLVRAGSDAIESVALLGGRPLLILHGTSDEIVPHAHGPLLHEAARAAGIDVVFVSVEGAGHVDWIDTHPEMSRAIVEFFREHLLADDQAGVGPAEIVEQDAEETP